MCKGSRSNVVRLTKLEHLAEPLSLSSPQVGSTTIHIGGMCKGSGMIHPNMATMLGVSMLHSPFSIVTLEPEGRSAFQDGFEDRLSIGHVQCTRAMSETI
jgi:N-acetylglutamate synthase/N-acetylornithine aminotransferase